MLIAEPGYPPDFNVHDKLGACFPAQNSEMAEGQTTKPCVCWSEAEIRVAELGVAADEDDTVPSAILRPVRPGFLAEKLQQGQEHQEDRRDQEC